jgi:hypothetical protein
MLVLHVLGFLPADNDFSFSFPVNSKQQEGRRAIQSGARI